MEVPLIVLVAVRSSTRRRELGPGAKMSTTSRRSRNDPRVGARLEDPTVMLPPRRAARSPRRRVRVAGGDRVGHASGDRVAHRRVQRRRPRRASEAHVGDRRLRVVPVTRRRGNHRRIRPERCSPALVPRKRRTAFARREPTTRSSGHVCHGRGSRSCRGLGIDVKPRARPPAELRVRLPDARSITYASRRSRWRVTVGGVERQVPLADPCRDPRPRVALRGQTPPCANPPRRAAPRGSRRRRIASSSVMRARETGVAPRRTCSAMAWSRASLSSARRGRRHGRRGPQPVLGTSTTM